MDGTGLPDWINGIDGICGAPLGLKEVWECFLSTGLTSWATLFRPDGLSEFSLLREWQDKGIWRGD